MYYLYRITNKVNGKLYFGVTCRPKRRFYLHTHSGSKCTKMKNAISKYGVDNFLFEILVIGEKEYILDLERKCIEKFNTTENGYNICKGGKDYPSDPFEGRDRSVFVSGFWFPDCATAMQSLNVKQGQYYGWMRKGILGSEAKPDRRGLPGGRGPVFIKGFWFPKSSIAMKVLGISRGQVRRLKDIEDPSKEWGAFQSQAGSKSPSAKAVIINGIEYGSIKEASRELHMSTRTIGRRIDKQIEGYSFKNKE